MIGRIQVGGPRWQGLTISGVESKCIGEGVGMAMVGQIKESESEVASDSDVDSEVDSEVESEVEPA